MTGTRRLVGLLLVAFLGVAAPIGAAAAAPGVPTVDDGQATLRIVIDELVPAIPGPDDVLRISGRVISSARTAVSDVSVQLRRSESPLGTRQDVGQVFDAGLTPATGDPDARVVAGASTTVDASLPPGGRGAFTLRVPVADLGFTEAGTYALGLEALAREDGVDATSVRKGVVRTFLSWYPPGSTVTPIQLVWLWPLADWPARTADGTLLDNRTPAELSPGGRLDQLLQIGGRFRSTVSWLADPALLQTAAGMTQGYQVLQDGALVVGDQEQQAETWLTELSDVTRAAGLRALPYADIDASAVTRAGMSNDVVRAVTQGPAVASSALGSAVVGDLYWAPFGRINRPALDVLASAGVTTLVLSADAMPATDPAQPTDGMAIAALPTSVGSIRTVLTDPGLTKTLSLPQRSASDVILARQRFLAETALIAQALPADQSARAVVAAPSSVRWAPTASLLSPLLRATRTAPWLSALSLQDLLTAPTSSTSRQRAGYSSHARDAELGEDYMLRVSRLNARLDVLSSIIDDPTGISEPFAEALLRSESSAWRTEPLAGERLLTSISEGLDEETARVRVLSVGTITFSGDTGRVPVTITNELDRSVTVGLDLRGRPALRLSSEPLTGIRIEAGKMASVDIEARVVGGDPLTVDVQLLGPEGESYGKPATITVTSTAYARAAAWVVAAAFLAILVFVVVGVTRRIRKAQAARGPSGLGT